MKKTLTVNLGGTVYHIDEDAYRLLDNYLNNLRLHFSKEECADEIVDDIERRISELFSEKLVGGIQVITIADVEEVIARVGNPEEMEAEEKSTASADEAGNAHSDKEKVNRRLFRNPDDKMIGGVVSGLGAYTGWDVTVLRLFLLVILVCGCGTLVPIYIICWLVIPEAGTAAEKLAMRGEAITVENIGKTVTDGFERAAKGVNSYMKSDKPRTALQKVGDVLVIICGWLLKIGLVLFAVVFSPVLFVIGVLFMVLFFMVMILFVDGGTTLVKMFPTLVLPAAAPFSAIVMYLAGVLMVGIPLFALVWSCLAALLKWQPMARGLNWTLILLWIVSIACFGICFGMQGGTLPDLGILSYNI